MNKKIRNATTVKVKGIKFKSKLEKTIYDCLLQQGFDPLYEPVQYTLWDGFQPITPFYDQETPKQKLKREVENPDIKSAGKKLILKNNKIIGIRYTPDLYFKYKDIDIFIEVKSIENDVYYIKKKLFIKYLDNKLLNTGIKSLFFEVHTKKQLLQAIDIIKEYEESSEQNEETSS